MASRAKLLGGTQGLKYIRETHSLEKVHGHAKVELLGFAHRSICTIEAKVHG